MEPCGRCSPTREVLATAGPDDEPKPYAPAHRPTCRQALESERAGRSQYPFCVWADYSTVAVTVPYGTFEEQKRGEFMPLSELAELTAKLYNTSRTKV
ncbi:hypothetical protein [Streptomyces sp. NPDC005407]|uniref:hypothetical protein n=1 Tax=Streptomyces sp. NPDC005407 TaxID=3155340 RepID=UPI0033AA6505